MMHIELDGMKYDVPESWDEVNRERLPKVIELVYFTPESGQMHHALIQNALNIRPKAWKKLHQKHFAPNLSHNVRRENAAVLQQLVALISWLWLKPMTKQPFPSISIASKTFLLPEPGFVSMSFGELTDLHIHLQAFVEQTVPGDERLNYLVATACRPRRPRGYTIDSNWNGDHREEYNEFIVRERLKAISTVDYRERIAVMLYVAATLKAVMAQFDLFDKATPGKAPESTEAYGGQSFIKNQHLLAQKGIFGNLKQTQQANAHEVLLFLEEHRQDLLTQQTAEEDESN